MWVWVFAGVFIKHGLTNIIHFLPACWYLITLLTFIWTPTQRRSFKNKRFCCHVLSGGEIRAINLKMLLVFSAQKCWLAHQEGRNQLLPPRYVLLPTLLPWRLTLGVATPPPIHSHKRRLNCVGVCVQSLERRLLSPPQRSCWRGISSQKFFPSWRNPDINNTFTPPDSADGGVCCESVQEYLWSHVEIKKLSGACGGLFRHLHVGNSPCWRMFDFTQVNPSTAAPTGMQHHN